MVYLLVIYGNFIPSFIIHNNKLDYLIYHQHYKMQYFRIL
jgi:hypothetical protein